MTTPDTSGIPDHLRTFIETFDTASDAKSPQQDEPNHAWGGSTYEAMLEEDEAEL